MVSLVGNIAEATLAQSSMLSSSMMLSNATSSEELNGDHNGASAHLSSNAQPEAGGDDPANGTMLSEGKSMVDFADGNEMRENPGGGTSNLGTASGVHEQGNNTGFADAGTGGKEGGSRPAKRPREPPQQVWSKSDAQCSQYRSYYGVSSGSPKKAVSNRLLS